jgi:hypothetical protein
MALQLSLIDLTLLPGSPTMQLIWRCRTFRTHASTPGRRFRRTYSASGSSRTRGSARLHRGLANGSAGISQLISFDVVA